MASSEAQPKKNTDRAILATSISLSSLYYASCVIVFSLLRWWRNQHSSPLFRVLELCSKTRTPASDSSLSKLLASRDRPKTCEIWTGHLEPLLIKSRFQHCCLLLYHSSHRMHINHSHTTPAPHSGCEIYARLYMSFCLRATPLCANSLTLASCVSPDLPLAVAQVY